jgi:methanogenic corrinoid protein MtbC1
MSETLNELRQAILEGDDDIAGSLTRRALVENIPPINIVNQAIVAGIQEAGELWKNNEYFLSDVIMCVEAFQVGMEILKPHLALDKNSTFGRYVIGTVAGDMHNLGKLIVVALLQSAGFDVIDLGEDVPTETFIDKVKELKPNILGLGCYMTTTMREMKNVIDSLTACGIRDDIKIMIGGIPTSQTFADEIGADGWGSDALNAVTIAKQLVNGD